MYETRTRGGYHWHHPNDVYEDNRLSQELKHHPGNGAVQYGPLVATFATEEYANA